MTLNTESDPYDLKLVQFAPVQKLYSSTAQWYIDICHRDKNTLNWMLMVKENIDTNANTVTLPDYTVLRYTGGCILHDSYRDGRIDSIYSYLFATNPHFTLIITNKSMIKRWININKGKFKFTGMRCYPIYFLHDIDRRNKTISADIIITTIDTFTEIINPPPNFPNHIRSVLSNLRNRKWCNLVIDRFVSSELVNNINATYKWVTMSEASLSRENVQNMLDIILPHHYELYTNHYSYILPSVVMNAMLEAEVRLTDSIIDVHNVRIPSGPKILDPAQNIECEVKAGTDSECCICANDYDNSKRVGIRLSCGHQFCTECINTFKSSSVTCFMCRQKCSLRYVIDPLGISVTDYYVNVIREHSFFNYAKCILCVNDTNHIEILYDRLKVFANVMLLNKRLITVKDINSFKNSNSALLIMPYEIKFELGVNLLRIRKAFIICHQERVQCYEYLMRYLERKELYCPIMNIVKLI